MRFITLCAAALAVAFTTSVASAHHDGEIVEKNGVRASHAHTAEPAAASHGIDVYLTIENLSDAPDRLIAAEVPFAAPGRFEANVLGADGTLTVAVVPAVALAPGQTVTMQPGGLRLVFDDVKRELHAGDHFELTLTFETAGTLVMVGEVEAADQHGGEDHHHDHDHEEADQADPAS